MNPNLGNVILILLFVPKIPKLNPKYKGKYHRGKRVEGQWVFGGVERETGKCFLVPVENRNAKTLITLITKWIKKGSIIISDCWKAYNSIRYQY